MDCIEASELCFVYWHLKPEEYVVFYPSDGIYSKTKTWLKKGVAFPALK